MMPTTIWIGIRPTRMELSKPINMNERELQAKAVVKTVPINPLNTRI